MERKIDVGSWSRREIYSFFSGVSNPFYAVTFRQDVTKLHAYAKRNGLSFYYSLIWLCTRAINETEAFRYTIRGGEVYRLDGRAPSFTDLKKGGDCFYIVTMPCEGTLAEFNAAAKARSAAQTAFLEQDAETDALIYFSCLPWMDVTSVTNARNFAAQGAAEDSVPHIAWGRYVRNGERLELGISVEVNHRLIDGVHIGRFAEKLTERIEGLE